MFPLFIKAALGRQGCYVLTPEDRLRDAAFDTLLTHDLFAEESGGPGAEEDGQFPWRRVMLEFRLRAVQEQVQGQIVAEGGLA